MKFRKALREQSKEKDTNSTTIDAYAQMREPEKMYISKKGANAAETTVSHKPTNPDNEELIIQIERACMLNNFLMARQLLEKYWDQLTLNDVNRLIQFSRHIAGDTIRNIAAKQEKPDFEKFADRFLKVIKKKMTPK